MKLLAPLALTLLLLAGCGDDSAAPSVSSSVSPSVSPSPSASSTPSPSPSAADSPLLIRPGALGDVRVGMTRAEWTATGRIEDGAALCAEQVRWVGGGSGGRTGIVVLSDGEKDARITQITVFARGPRTATGGLHVGSTYGELRAAFPTLSPLVEDGWDGASTYPPGEEDGRPYLAFLLGTPPAEVTDATKITAIAVTAGEKPYFQYDC